MFCRKCGSKIPDDSTFCQNCGVKVIVLHEENKQPEIIEVTSDKPDTSGNIDSFESGKTDNEVQKESFVPITPNNKSKSTKVIIGIIVALSVIGLIIYAIYLSTICEYDGCSNTKSLDGDYCYRHTCEAFGCYNKKSYSGDYCYAHSCRHIDCHNRNVNGGLYCAEHTCATSGCMNEVKGGSKYCSDHYVENDMRKKVSNSSFGFTLNSAGGIKFYFYAKNSTQKTIKYVRFKVYLKNKVDDSIRDKITRKYCVDVEIIGPFSPGGDIRMSDEIIGYNDNLDRIDIYDITLIYSDGTSETGGFNYYSKK